MIVVLEIRRLTIVAVAFAVILMAASAKTYGQESPSPEQVVRDLEAQLNGAYVRQDVSVLERLLANDGRFTTTDGRTVDKPNRVAALSRKFPDMSNDVRSVVVLGHVAVVNAVTSYTAGSGARSSSTVLRIWHKQNESWRVIAFQATVQPNR